LECVRHGPEGGLSLSSLSHSLFPCLSLSLSLTTLLLSPSLSPLSLSPSHSLSLSPLSFSLPLSHLSLSHPLTTLSHHSVPLSLHSLPLSLAPPTQRFNTELRAVLREPNMEDIDIRFRRSNFLSIDWSDGDLIFANSTCFRASLMVSAFSLSLSLSIYLSFPLVSVLLPSLHLSASLSPPLSTSLSLSPPLSLCFSLSIYSFYSVRLFLSLSLPLGPLFLLSSPALNPQCFVLLTPFPFLSSLSFSHPPPGRHLQAVDPSQVWGICYHTHKEAQGASPEIHHVGRKPNELGEWNHACISERVRE